MYSLIRKYQFDPSAGKEIAQKFQEGLIPLLRQTRGFVVYYWMDDDHGQGASLGIFENEAGANESVRIVADFIKENLAALLGQPEITRGEVRAHGTGMHLRAGDIKR
jgi:hypothetical protein